MAKDKKKRKSQAPIALVYFSTMVVFIVILGAIALVLMNNLVDETEKTSSVSVSDDKPTDENNQTFFYMVKDGDNNLETAMLARILPADGKIMLVPLSPYTMTSANGAENTLAEVFESGGASDATSAISETLGISIDRYMSMSEECFENVCDNIGSITYEVFEDMYYVDKNSDDVTNYTKGDKISLQGSEMRLFITYPKYSNGYSQNVMVAGEFMQSLINNGFKLQTTRDNLESIYSSLLKESSEKNFNSGDFSDNKEYYYYIIDNFDNPAYFLTPTGTWSEKGYQFTADESFKAQIKSAFKLS